MYKLFLYFYWNSFAVSQASAVEKIKNSLAEAWKYFMGDDNDELDHWIDWEVDTEKVIVHPEYHDNKSKFTRNHL